MAQAMAWFVHPQDGKTTGRAQNTRQILNHHQGAKDRAFKRPSSGSKAYQFVFKVDECIFDPFRFVARPCPVPGL
jgi:hypothetical protein